LSECRVAEWRESRPIDSPGGAEPFADAGEAREDGKGERGEPAEGTYLEETEARMGCGTRRDG